MHSILFLACLPALAFWGQAAAKQVPIVGRSSPYRLSAKLSRRILGSTSLNDDSDIQYYTNITLGGQSVQVSIDTGSSDLWVAKVISDSQDLGVQGSVNYAIGSVSGNLHTSKFNFAGYDMPSQVFIQVNPADNQAGGDGLIGLGPDFGSGNWLALSGATQGDTPLANIFKQDPSAPNILTFSLGRADIATNTQEFEGFMTVGEVEPGYEAVQNQPKLSVPLVNNFKNDSQDQHWQALLDANGVKVNGQSVSLPQSTVKGAQNPAQLTAVFDSGFSFPQIPKAITDAMYSSIPGAVFKNVTKTGPLAWLVNCSTEINLSFTFGGVEYPIHPLDATLSLTDNLDDGCVGIWQPIGVDSGSIPDTLDMILGMGFLRNTYTLINLGDFIDGQFDSKAQPFIQLLSTTNDSTKAHNEFLAARTPTTSTTGSKGSGKNGAQGRGSQVLYALASLIASSLALCL